MTTLTQKICTNNFILHQIGSWNTQNLNATSLWGRASGLVTFYVELNSVQHTNKRYLCESRIDNQTILNQRFQLLCWQMKRSCNLCLKTGVVSLGWDWLHWVWHLANPSCFLSSTSSTLAWQWCSPPPPSTSTPLPLLSLWPCLWLSQGSFSNKLSKHCFHLSWLWN